MQRDTLTYYEIVLPCVRKRWNAIWS